MNLSSKNSEHSIGLYIYKYKYVIMEIKVLGSGCPSCIKLENNVKLALEKSRIKATLTKVTDYAKIMEYGIMSTPALVIDEKVVSYNRILPVDEIIQLIKNN